MQDPKTDFLKTFETIDFEKIKDHPNILIAANFWEEERYQAAKVCYKLMRYVDDLVDNYKTEHPVISEPEKNQLISKVNEWISSIISVINSDGEKDEFYRVFKKFVIPVWYMNLFAKSMLYDIDNDGFPDIKTYLEYSEGASVAPASIFVHLCSLRYIDGQYCLPTFDVIRASRPCAIFSYLVHIIRDFQKDQQNNLNYFADDIVKKYGLDRTILKAMANGSPVVSGYRKLVREYLDLADKYRIETQQIIKEIRPELGSEYKLSLDIIFNLYQMVFDKIDPENGNLMTDYLNPTPDETRQMVLDTINNFKE
jgi:phytoene synthase